MNKLASIIALFAVAGTLEACEGHLSPFIKKAPSAKGEYKNEKRQRTATASLKDLCLKMIEKSFYNLDINQQEFVIAITQSLPNELVARLYNNLYSKRTATARGKVTYVELISPRKAKDLTPGRSGQMLAAITRNPMKRKNLFDEFNAVAQAPQIQSAHSGVSALSPIPMEEEIKNPEKKCEESK